MARASSCHSNNVFVFVMGVYFLLMLEFFLHSGYADCFKVSRIVVWFLFRSGLAQDFGSDQRLDAAKQVCLWYRTEVKGTVLNWAVDLLNFLFIVSCSWSWKKAISQFPQHLWGQDCWSVLMSNGACARWSPRCCPRLSYAGPKASSIFSVFKSSQQPCRDFNFTVTFRIL